MRTAPSFRSLLHAITACSAAALTACQAGPGALGSPAAQRDVAGSERTVRADWDDLDAALDVAFTRCEFAALTRTTERVNVERTDRYSPEPYADDVEVAVRWRLTTRDGRGGELSAVRTTEDALGNGRDNEIDLRVRLGPFGTPSEERCVLDAIASRLKQLRGPVARGL